MVINVDANHGVNLPAETVPGLMHVYCVNSTATFGISIYNPPPPWIWHHLNAGHMLTFQVDRFAVWVFNNGPSRIQLLYPDFLLEGKSIGEVEGAIPISRVD